MKKYLSWLGSLVLVLGALLQFLLFDHLCAVTRFHVGVSLLYNIVPALAIATLAMLPRRRSMAIGVVSLLFMVIDVWMICNVMYFRANGLYITWQVAQLVGQLWGVSSSFSACWSGSLLLFPLISVVSILIYAVTRPHRTLLGFCTCGTLCVGLFFVSGCVRYATRHHPSELSWAWFMPTSIPESETSGVWAVDYDRIVYLRMHSIADYLVCFCYDAIHQMAEEGVTLNDEDKQSIQLLLSPPAPQATPRGHLIYILVESMEGWILNYYDQDGNPVCPHILQWIGNHPSLVCEQVRCQKVYGESGDGQMICMTGMLPIDDGVACNTYGTNVYPNFAHFYSNSAVLNPMPYMWNKEITTYSYGFKQLIEPVKESPHWDDQILFEKAKDFLLHAEEPACALILTIDTHMPFDQHLSSMALPDTMTLLQRNYICAFHYTDSVIGEFLAWAEKSLSMENATVVITGDHYAFSSGFPGCPPHLCPLVMTSPLITENVRPYDMDQMDIFSTLLHAIGQDSYFWHGFGMDHLNPNAERVIPLGTAWQLSNKMIRTNYFADVQ